MKRRLQALRLTVYLEENGQHGSGPVSVELVARARAAGLAGATVMRATEGFGPARVHVWHPRRSLWTCRVIVTIVDTPDGVRAFARSVAELTAAGLALIQPVDMITYRAR